MLIQSTGLSHHTADISIREKLALSEEDAKKFILDTMATLKLEEMAVLSTCNRVEIYAIAEENKLTELQSALLEFCNVEQSIFPDSFYKLTNHQVVAHLFRVAAGLDSLALGEPQILGQVTNAYEISRSANAAGKLISKLFQTAVHAGKRVRSETAIGERSITVSSLSAKLAKKHFDTFEDLKILLLGAGEMAELAIEAFRKRGASDFTVLSRTLESACILADRWKGEAGTMEMLEDSLEKADIIVSSSSAPHILIDAEMINRIIPAKPERPMIILDIAVPRDVSPEVGDFKNIHLYNIDSLRDGVEDSQQARSREVPKAEVILDEEYKEFMEFISSLKILPLIKELRKQVDEIRAAELEKTLNQIPDLTPEIREKIKGMSHSIVNKILHNPTVSLRENSDNERVDELSFMVRELFGIKDPNQ